MAQRDDRYDHLYPLLVEYASMAHDGPRRDQAHEQLVVGFLPLAHHIARRFSGRGQPTEDLEQVATMGLLGALKRFDPERRSDFLSFAVPTIMGEVRRYFRDSAWAVRTPRHIKDQYVGVRAATARLGQTLNRAPTVAELASEMGLTHDEVAEAVAAHGSLQPASLDEAMTTRDDSALTEVLGELDPGLERAEARALVHDLVARLPGRERTILALRFVHDQTQYEIAQFLGISQMHVSRLLTRTLRQLRAHIDEQLEVTAPDDLPHELRIIRGRPTAGHGPERTAKIG